MNLCIESTILFTNKNITHEVEQQICISKYFAVVHYLLINILNDSIISTALL